MKKNTIDFIAQTAAALQAKDKLQNAFLKIRSKNKLKITVTIDNTSYTFGSADYEFDDLCEIIKNIDVEAEWGDCEF